MHRRKNILRAGAIVEASLATCECRAISRLVIHSLVSANEPTRQLKVGDPYGEKTRPGYGPEQQLFARRPSMINQAREVLVRENRRNRKLCHFIQFEFFDHTGTAESMSQQLI